MKMDLQEVGYGGVLIGSSWLRIRTGGRGQFLCGNELSGSVNCWESLD